MVPLSERHRSPTGRGLSGKRDVFVTRPFHFRYGGIKKGRRDCSHRPRLFQGAGRSGRRRDVVVFGLWLASGAATRLGRLFLAVIAGSADGRWQDAKRNSFLGLAFIFFIAAGAIGASLARTILPVEPFTAASTIALADLSLTIIIAVVGFRADFLVALDVVLVIVAARPALGLLLLEARAAVLEHTEVMVGVLEIIFGLDTVAGKLGVTSQALVFFEQLGGIAALAIITGVATGIAGHTLRTLSTAATTTAALTVVDQV